MMMLYGSRVRSFLLNAALAMVPVLAMSAGAFDYMRAARANVLLTHATGAALVTASHVDDLPDARSAHRMHRASQNRLAFLLADNELGLELGETSIEISGSLLSMRAAVEMPTRALRYMGLSKLKITASATLPARS